MKIREKGSECFANHAVRFRALYSPTIIGEHSAQKRLLTGWLIDTDAREPTVAVFLDTRCLADALTQIKEFRTADHAAADHFDPIETRGVNQKGSFDADAVGDFAHHERVADTFAMSGDANPFENLNTLFVAFNNLCVNPHGCAASISRMMLPIAICFCSYY